MKQNRIDLQEKTQHGDMLLPLTIYHPTLGSMQRTLFPHWHNQIEISFIKKGRAYYSIDLEEYAVQEGDVIVIPPECLHSGRAMEGIESENITVVFDLSMLATTKIDGCTAKYIMPLQAGELRVNPHIPAAERDVPALVDAIRGIAHTFETTPAGYELLLKAQTLMLLHILYASGHIQRCNDGANNADTEKLKQVLGFINANYAKEIYVSDIAQAVNYSPSYLTRFFKRATRMTCLEYIQKMRIHRAAELLLSTQLTVTEISLEVGVPNTSHFIRQFKCEYSATPSHYRAQAMRSAQT